MLEKINNLNDLKNLSPEQLVPLCQEIRTKLIESVTDTGGHLASNLGAVELTVALHYVFGEQDKIVFDVGHQCYVHKMLTGRLDKMSTLRQLDGLSGFCDPSESKFDTTISGHASVSLSQALGIATARDLKGENYKVVAVLGDGALTGGMTYEALNNIKKQDMLIVLNDNNMSIDKNVGTLSKNISKIRVGKYDKRKESLKRFLHKLPLIGKPIYRFLRWFAHRLKWMILKNNYFEVFDLKYIGIIDGNDIKELLYYLKKIKSNVTAPTVLHIATKKGKGFEPAETQPSKYHSIPFVDKSNLAGAVVDKTLSSLAEENDKITAITAAMTDGVGLIDFAERFPNKFFDVGIAEEHAVTFAAGLATGGAKPFVAIYSTFLQRSYDQIVHDVALPNLPVTFLLDRAGLVGSDGKTHQGIQDLSYLSNIPNMQIWTPFNQKQLQQMIEMSVDAKNPVAIRYSKYLSDSQVSFDGSWNVLKRGGKLKLLAVGCNMVENCFSALEQIENSDEIEIVAVTTVKPLDKNYLSSIKNDDIVLTFEENQLNGGFGSLISQHFSSTQTKVINFGVNDEFVPHATVSQQLEMLNLDSNSIRISIEKIIEENS